jgi:hypothetical protein
MLIPEKTKDIIKNLFESGQSFPDIAEATGIPINEVKALKAKGKWGRQPKKQLAMAEAQLVNDEADAADILAAAEEALHTNPGKRHSDMVFKKVHAALTGLKSLPPLKNWKDIELADKIARRAAGLDREGSGGGTVINLGIIAGGYKPRLAPSKKVVDLQVVEG